MRVLLCVSLLLAIPAAAQVPAPEPDHETHEELRGILRTVVNAVNTENYDAMLPVLSEDLRATTITQENINGRAQVVPYFTKWFGPGGFLKKLEMSLEADTLTELSPDKTWGIVRGSGVESYTLADGRFYPMKTRWTATVAKEADGKWRLRAIHFGTDFLDNPILDEAKTKARNYTAFAGGGGLLGGLLLGFLFGRRRK
jgi:ketosteroid isomerase-like protein